MLVQPFFPFEFFQYQPILTIEPLIIGIKPFTTKSAIVLPSSSSTQTTKIGSTIMPSKLSHHLPPPPDRWSEYWSWVTTIVAKKRRDGSDSNSDYDPSISITIPIPRHHAPFYAHHLAVSLSLSLSDPIVWSSIIPFLFHSNCQICPFHIIFLFLLCFSFFLKKNHLIYNLNLNYCYLYS